MEREVIYWLLDVYNSVIARLAILYSLGVSSVRESKKLLPVYYCYMLLSDESGLPDVPLSLSIMEATSEKLQQIRTCQQQRNNGGNTVLFPTNGE